MRAIPKKLINTIIVLCLTAAAVVGSIYACNHLNNNKLFNKAHENSRNLEFEQAITVFNRDSKYGKKQIKELNDSVELANRFQL